MSSPLRHRTVHQQQSSVSSVTGTTPQSSSLQFASVYSSGGNGEPPVKSMYNIRNNLMFGSQRTSSRRLLFNEPLSSSSDYLVGSWRQKLILAAGFLVLAAPWIRHSSTLWKVRNLQQELSLLQRDQRRLQSRLGMQTDTLKRVKSEVTDHKKRNDVLLGELKKHGDSFEDFDSAHYAAAEVAENEYFKRVEGLEAEIQRSAGRKLAKRGYGASGGEKSAIRVEIVLTKEISTFGNKLVMELGPVNLLGHAIELFLMLVEHKHFYDHLTLMHRTAGSSTINTVPMDSETMQLVSSNFVRGGHPVVGSPESRTPVDLKAEDEFMLQELALVEQTERYPVKKYSVLFAEKGPHFYINMEEKGKNSNDLRETCFGKIVEGTAILDFMASHHEKNFHGMSMIGIETVRVIQSVEDPVADPRLPPRSKTSSSHRW